MTGHHSRDGQRPVALVTGAAGGVGSAVVQALVDDGVTVAAVDRDSDALARLLGHVAGGSQVVDFATDVTDIESVRITVGRVEREVGPIGLLVNAAGVLTTADPVELDLADWDYCMAVNARGVVAVSQEVVRRMLPRRTGCIVTISSNAARVPRAGMAAYSASKAAATSYAKSLGLAVAPLGIRCNVVSPGSTLTPMLSRSWDGADKLHTTIAGDPEAFRLGIPIGRLASPQDIAAVVLFLLGDKSRHMTLQDVTVDGGATLGV